MIVGIGTDIVAVARMQAFWERHGEQGLERLLAPEEREEARKSAAPGRLLAKRFAAKEALGKALGTGIRAPVLLDAMRIDHDEQGKPYFRFTGALAADIERRGLGVHVSISDEQDYAVAFVMVEKA